MVTVASTVVVIAGTFFVDIGAASDADGYLFHGCVITRLSLNS